MTRTYASFGSISTGTLRTADLVDAFAGELADLDADNAHAALLAECDAWQEFDEDNEDSDAVDSHASLGDDLVAELGDALNEFAPPYGYFGAHSGDGADFGFWLSESFAEDFDGLKVDDTSEVPADYSGEVLHVNDHGNATLYVADAGKLNEVWAVV